MARPRVFVSSTYFDLRHIRNGLGEEKVSGTVIHAIFVLGNGS